MPESKKTSLGSVLMGIFAGVITALLVTVIIWNTNAYHDLVVEVSKQSVIINDGKEARLKSETLVKENLAAFERNNLDAHSKVEVALRERLTEFERANNEAHASIAVQLKELVSRPEFNVQIEAIKARLLMLEAQLKSLELEVAKLQNQIKTTAIFSPTNKFLNKSYFGFRLEPTQPEIKNLP